MNTFRSPKHLLLSCSLVLAALLVFTGCEEASIPTSVSEGESPTSDELLASKRGDAIAGQYIVVLKEEFAPGAHAANQAAAAEIARGLGLAPLHTYGTALFGFAAAIPEGRLQGLRRDPRVAYIDLDTPMSIPDQRVLKPCWMTNTCDGDGGSTGETLPWGVDRIDADLNSNEGAGIHVYIIDTGIDSDHADLTNLGNGYAVETCKGGGCNYDWDDDHDHGTHVAGTVGAIDNEIDVIGVASQVTLHAVKVLSKAGSGTRSGVIAGIDWVTSETARLKVATVANMSLGGSGSKSGFCTSTGFTGTDSYHQAICNSAHAGVVYAVAAGNDGADAEGAVPAAYDDAVITVSATNSSDQWESWSNWGDESASWTTNASAPVAIGAPGGSILSTKRGGGTTTMSGTSMASPHAAGAAALYLASEAQSAAYSAFTNTRSALLSKAEDAAGFVSEDSNNLHEEDFLDAEHLKKAETL